MTRVAAVDVGTHSTRLLVADVEDGRVVEVSRRLEFTRLGEGVDARRILLPTAVARVRNCLVGYRRELSALGAERTLLVATSAVRDAGNGEAFLAELEWSFGFDTRLLSGREEAELTFAGVASDGVLTEDVLVVDIGGGSTELLVGGPDGVRFVESLQLGCTRVTERHLHTDPPTEAELAALARDVRSTLPPLAPPRAVGVAGTVTTLATLDLGLPEEDPALLHRHRLTRAAVERGFRRLASLPLAERARVPGVPPGRAPVIVGGAAVLREILDAYALDTIEVSERDLLHGAALAAAALPPREEGAAPPGAYTAC